MSTMHLYDNIHYRLDIMTQGVCKTGLQMEAKNKAC